MALISQKRSAAGSAFKKLLTVVVVVGVAAGRVILSRGLKLPPPATVELTSDLPAIGRKTTFTLKVSEPVKGIESVAVTVDKTPLTVALNDGSGTFVVGKETMPGLKPGQATVEVTV